MGGDITETHYYQNLTTKAAHSKQKGKKSVTKKSPKSGIEIGEQIAKIVHDPNKIEYDPIPKYHGMSATDLWKKAVGLT